MLNLLRVKIRKLVARRIYGWKLYGYEFGYGSLMYASFYDMIKYHVHTLRWILGREVEVDERVLEAFRKKYGSRPAEPYCLCRFERSWRTVCPCVWHIEELAKYGRCKCGLFKVKK